MTDAACQKARAKALEVNMESRLNGAMTGRAVTVAFRTPALRHIFKVLSKDTAIGTSVPHGQQWKSAAPHIPVVSSGTVRFFNNLIGTSSETFIALSINVVFIFWDSIDLIIAFHF